MSRSSAKRRAWRRPCRRSSAPGRRLIFLDIELGGGDGFDLLAALDKPPVVVFVTAYAEHAVEAFAVNAVDYLLKPVAPERLAESLTRVERQLARGEEPASTGRGVIALRTPKRTLLAQTDEIVAVRADGDFTHVFVADQPALMIWRTLGSFREPAAVAAVPAARPLADRQSRPAAPGRDAVARERAHPAAGHGRGADLGPRRVGAPARGVGRRRVKPRRNTALRDRKFDSSRPGCNDPRNKRRKSGMAVDWASSTVEAGGTKLHVKRAGRGRPLLVLHHETGTLDDLPFYDALAANHEVIVPHHPGYSRSERPDWMRSVRDIAVIYRGLLSELKVAKPALVGLGFGGWIAAEMATMAPADLSHLVLVGAMGIKPPQGDILDLAVTGYIDYARAAFHDQKAFDRVYGAEPSVDQLEMWDICREMSFRIAWKPYMYSQTLPHLLKTMRAPALIVWGDDDKVVPISAGKRYLESLPDAHLEIVRSCGHAVDMEQPEALAKLVTNFIGRE